MLEKFAPLVGPIVTAFLGIWQTTFAPIIKNWWWIFPPLILIKPFSYLWLWWRKELYDKNFKYILLEVKLPKEVIKPIKAMEDVFAGMWMIYDPPVNFREKWIDGIFSPQLSFEICGFNGESHFFIRVDDRRKEVVKSNIYSQYPEAEISEIDDYTKHIPQDIPNKDWNMEGRELMLRKPNPYPIKTYQKLETGTEPLEEKRVDPIARLLEGLASLKEGEQIWIQFFIEPIVSEIPWVAEGEKIRDALAKREKLKPKPKSIIGTLFDLTIDTIKRAADILLAILEGKTPPEPEGIKPEEKEMFPPEMRLTPGEREIVEEVERKISKCGFAVTIRIIYIGKKEVFFKPRLGIPFSFFGSSQTQHLNSFKLVPGTSTKVRSTLAWYLDKRKAFLKKRRMFRNHVKRYSPYFPRPGGVSVLNIEEMASLFHFPGSLVAPTPSLPRIESRREEAPPTLPIGE